MQRDNFHHPIKQKSRERAEKFIKNYLIKATGKDPRNITVATLLGPPYIDPLTGEYRHGEIEVYDRLHIPRSNIYAIERQKSTVDILHNSNLIPKDNIFFGNDIDFFKTTGKKFDVINLDYQGYLSKEEISALMLISGRQLLSEKSVLMTTFLASREKPEDKMFYRDQSIRPYENFKLLVPEESEKLDNTIKKKIVEFEDDYTSAKQSIIPNVITGYMTEGLDIFRINPLFLRNPKFDFYTKKAREQKFQNLEYSLDLYKKICNLPENETISLLIHNRSFFKLLHRVDILDYLKGVEFLRPGADEYRLVSILGWFYSRPYLEREMEAYSYNNDKGKMLFVNFFNFDQKREFIDKFGELAELIWRKKDKMTTTEKLLIFYYLGALEGQKYNNKNPLFLTKAFIKNLNSKLKNILGNIYKSGHERERVYLGSSYKPKLTMKEYFMRIKDGWHDDKIKEVYNVNDDELQKIQKKLRHNARRGLDYLTDEKLLEELKRGKTWEEIEMLYRVRKSERRHFGAIAAHYKRGSYREEKTKTETLPVIEVKPPEFDTTAFIESLYYGIIDSKFEGRFGTQTTNMILDFCTRLADSTLVDEKKKEFLKSIKEAANGKPLNRLTKEMTFEQAEKFVNFLRDYVDKNTVPDPEDIIEKYRKCI